MKLTGATILVSRGMKVLQAPRQLMLIVVTHFADETHGDILHARPAAVSLPSAGPSAHAISGPLPDRVSRS